jgi:hypothetical protein
MYLSFVILLQSFGTNVWSRSAVFERNENLKKLTILTSKLARLSRTILLNVELLFKVKKNQLNSFSSAASKTCLRMFFCQFFCVSKFSNHSTFAARMWFSFVEIVEMYLWCCTPTKENTFTKHSISLQYFVLLFSLSVFY